MTKSGLGGRRVLVVEGESRIAMLIRDTLEELGCNVVAIASRLQDACEKARTLDLDAAFLDVNLSGDSGLPVARELAGRGVPFVLVIGYGDSKIPAELRQTPTLQKPFLRTELERALVAALVR